MSTLAGGTSRVRGTSPATDVVTDELWTLSQPLLPARAPAKRGRTGRPRLDDRAALEGIVFVLRTGTGWAELRRARLRLRLDVLAAPAGVV